MRARSRRGVSTPRARARVARSPSTCSPSVGAAALDVSQHRCLQRRSCSREKARTILDELRPRLETGRFGDGAILVEQVQDRISPVGCGDDVANAGAHEARDPSGGRQSHPLFPHFEHHHVACPRVEAGVSEYGRQRADAVAEAPGQFAKNQIMGGQELDNMPIGVERRGNERHAAEHAIGVKLLAQVLDVLHPVDDRQDRGANDRLRGQTGPLPLSVNRISPRPERDRTVRGQLRREPCAPAARSHRAGCGCATRHGQAVPHVADAP